MKNRKLFFESFAQRSGFDSLIADNWYQAFQEVRLVKVRGRGRGRRGRGGSRGEEREKGEGRGPLYSKLRVNLTY